MFTKQHFALQAKALGSHVIPELCTVRDWNANGALKWDVSKVESFHRLGNFLVDFFTMDNPAFDLDKFNKKMLEHATVAINSTGYECLAHRLDVPSPQYGRLANMGRFGGAAPFPLDLFLS